MIASSVLPRLLKIVLVPSTLSEPTGRSRSLGCAIGIGAPKAIDFDFNNSGSGLFIPHCGHESLISCRPD